MPNSPPAFHGIESFAAPPQRVFALLIDLDELARGLPGVESWNRPTANMLRAIVRPGVSILRGKLEMTVLLSDVHAPANPDSRGSFVMLTTAQGTGIELQVVTEAQLSRAGENTRLDWTSQLTRLSGLAARLSKPIIVPLVEQMIRQGWQRAREQLAEHPTTKTSEE